MTSLATLRSVGGLTAVGSIIPSGSGSTPTGYLACDGSAVSRATYAALFSVVGTTFGAGDGSTTFNLPNSSGLFLRGTGSQTVSGKSFNGGSIGNKQKDSTGINGLGISTSSTPSLSLSSTDLTHTHSYTDLTSSFTVISNASLGGSVGVPNKQGYAAANATEADTSGSALGSHSHTITPSITGIATTLSGSTETKPASITVAFYIKY